MYLKAFNVDEATRFIADQGTLGGDITIALPDGTLIKGTVIESSDANFNKLVKHATADALPPESFSVCMERLNSVGEAFLTRVGVHSGTRRLWTRFRHDR